jgi:FOG: HEAT repeat
MPEPSRDDLSREQLLDLASDRPELYKRSERWFCQKGPSTIGALLAGLENDEFGSVCHGRILCLLEYFAEQDTVSSIVGRLQRALRQRDFIVIGASIQTLSAFRTLEAAEELVALLSQNNLDILKQAAVAAGQTAQANVVPPLLALLSHEDPSVRFSAVKGLLHFTEPRVFQALRNHLEHETNAEVRDLIKLDLHQA